MQTATPENTKMRVRRSAYVQHLTDALAQEALEVARKKRKLIVAEAGSCNNCLCCKHTQTACGIKLFCKLKDKLVTQYNYCEKCLSLLDNTEITYPDSAPEI